MSESNADRRLAENEVIFRQMNEQVQAGFDHVNKLVTEDGQPEHRISHDENDLPLNFYCECSNEMCTERIRLNHATYNEIHKNRSQFIVKKGHQTIGIEKVVKELPECFIVIKNTPPPPSADTLNTTQQ